VLPFIGETFVPNPLPSKDVPQHPFLAALNGAHIDSYNSGVQDVSGPLGINPQVISRSMDFLFGTCGIHVFDPKGRLISGCARITLESMIYLYLFDPVDLSVLDAYPLPNTIFDVFGGGGGEQGLFIAGIYYHVDDLGRVFVGNVRNRFEVIEVVEVGGVPQWQMIDSLDLQPYLPQGHALMDMLYDWAGNLWFVTSEALIGYIDAGTGDVQAMQLEGEKVDNGMAVAEDGVYVVSDHALYRFEIDPGTGSPKFTWRQEYERATTPKPGSIALSSGTAPTLLGDDLITITDNADVQINLLVFDRINGDEICEVPLFEPNMSATDISMIGYHNSIIVENMYNAPEFLGDYRELAPGLTRIDVREDRSGCDHVWTNDVRSTTVPKLSTGTGLIYTFTQLLEYEDPVDAWYLVAIDFRTGDTVYQINLGTGRYKHNAFGMITLGADGTVYQGVLNGIMAIRDGDDAG
jgi:outer membrane protein assembly factor BamB